MTWRSIENKIFLSKLEILATYSDDILKSLPRKDNKVCLAYRKEFTHEVFILINEGFKSDNKIKQKHYLPPPLVDNMITVAVRCVIDHSSIFHWRNIKDNEIIFRINLVFDFEDLQLKTIASKPSN